MNNYDNTLLKINPENPEPDRIDEAVAILKSGGVIAFPTETFYGLGADARNESAIKKIFGIKGRDFKNPILVVIGDGRHLDTFAAEIPAAARKLMDRFWPGPLTLVFKAASSVSPMLTAGSGKIGIRLTSHPIAMELSKRLGGPLTATSANLSGAPECSSADGGDFSAGRKTGRACGWRAHSGRERIDYRRRDILPAETSSRGDDPLLTHTRHTCDSLETLSSSPRAISLSPLWMT